MKRQEFLKELNKFKHYIAHSNNFFIKDERFRYGKLTKLTNGQLIKKYGAIERIIVCFSKDISVYDNLLMNKNSFLLEDEIKHNTKLVLNDISFIEGKVGDLSDADFQQNLRISSITIDEKINYWKLTHPVWLIYTFIFILWNHRVISGLFIAVVSALIISYLKITN